MDHSRGENVHTNYQHNSAMPLGLAAFEITSTVMVISWELGILMVWRGIHPSASLQ